MIMAGHYRCKTVTSVFISKLSVLINFVKDILNHFCFTYFESFLSNIDFIHTNRVHVHKICPYYFKCIYIVISIFFSLMNDRLFANVCVILNLISFPWIVKCEMKMYCWRRQCSHFQCELEWRSLKLKWM